MRSSFQRLRVVGFVLAACGDAAVPIGADLGFEASDAEHEPSGSSATEPTAEVAANPGEASEAGAGMGEASGDDPAGGGERSVDAELGAGGAGLGGAASSEASGSEASGSEASGEGGAAAGGAAAGGAVVGGSGGAGAAQAGEPEQASGELGVGGSGGGPVDGTGGAAGFDGADEGNAQGGSLGVEASEGEGGGAGSSDGAAADNVAGAGSEGGVAGSDAEAGGASGAAGAGSQEPESFTLAVIGSSTAAGDGASAFDFAWVGLLEDSLRAAVVARLVVDNLAIGGYASTHLLPGSGFNGNLDDAIAGSPDLVVVALAGSNDLSSGTTTEEFMARLAVLRDAAFAAGIPVFFVSTAPKDLDLNEREMLALWAGTMGEAHGACPIPGVSAPYAPCFMDIFGALANSSLGLASELGAGDGIHLNDAGHARVFQVADAIIKPYVCSRVACR